jgi:hypothetical protein
MGALKLGSSSLNKQPRCCPKSEGRLTSFTAALASQSSTERGAIPCVSSVRIKNKVETIFDQSVSVDPVQTPRDLQGTEAPMRIFTVLAVAVAIAAIGFGLRTAFSPGSSADPGSVARATATPNTLLPDEIHLNYERMKELPVHEIKGVN